MRGDPIPRGGERRAPNPVFLAHARALTELYVTLVTQADAVGLALEYYGREGEARESFTHMGKERAVHATSEETEVLGIAGEAALAG